MLAAEALRSIGRAMQQQAVIGLDELFCYALDLRIVGPLLRASLDAWTTLEHGWLTRQEMLTLGMI
ncbi:MAG: hypothetical protein SGJ19_15240 [Planctomycetia bacterium]|nr:hypothetical protein [Planctomycetia bacterium]